MALPRRGPRWIWAGRVAGLAGLAGVAGYLVHVGLDEADKISSCLGLLASLVASLLPYLLPPAQVGSSAQVHRTGSATALDGATAVTGVSSRAHPDLVDVCDTGDAYACGEGSTAVTGIVRP
jgi:hypothetical protein